MTGQTGYWPRPHPYSDLNHIWHVDTFLSFEFWVDRSPNYGATGGQKSPLPID